MIYSQQRYQSLIRCQLKTFMGCLRLPSVTAPPAAALHQAKSNLAPRELCFCTHTTAPMWILQHLTTMSDKSLGGKESTILNPMACQSSPITLSKPQLHPANQLGVKSEKYPTAGMAAIAASAFVNINQQGIDKNSHSCIRTIGIHTTYVSSVLLLQCDFPRWSHSCCGVFVKHCVDSWKPEREREAGLIRLPALHSRCVISSPTQRGTPLPD